MDAVRFDRMSQNGQQRSFEFVVMYGIFFLSGISIQHDPIDPPVLFLLHCSIIPKSFEYY